MNASNPRAPQRDASGGAPGHRDAKGRFSKGRSGNPRGRPRKRPVAVSDRNEAALFFEADREFVTIIENGRRKKVPSIVAIYRVIRNKALQGDFRYAKLFVDLRQQFVEQVEETRARKLEHVLEIIAQAKQAGQMDDQTAGLLNSTLKTLNEPYDL